VLEENAGRWESASARDLARVEALARAVVGRLLHEPTIRLRSLDAERVHGSIELLRDLFALRGEGPSWGADARHDEAAGRGDTHDNVRELRSGKP
jgi:glutamyl-tRNA reductase